MSGLTDSVTGLSYAVGRGLQFQNAIGSAGLWQSSAGISAAQKLLTIFNDQQGLAIDFATDQSMVVADQTTPSNNYSSAGIVSSDGTLAGPGGKLSYSANSPSPKFCLQSNGNLAYAPHNLAQYTNQFSTANYTKTNASIAATGVSDPVGGSNASTLVPNTGTGIHYITMRSTQTIPTTCTLAIYVKAAGYSKVSLREGNTTGAYASFNLTGAGSVIDSGTGTTVSSITAVGNGWYYASYSFPISGVPRLDVYVLDNGYTTGAPYDYMYAGNGVSGVSIWGNIIQYQNTVKGFVNVPSTVAQFALPYEYNTSGACQGILVEQQSTNLLVQSNTFGTTWTTTNITNLTNTTTGPDGLTTSATLLNETVTNGVHSVQQTTAKAALALPYVYTVYAKQGVGRTRIALQMDDAAGNGAVAVYDLAGGAVGVAPAGVGTPFTALGASIVALPNGWYRCVLNATSNTATSIQCTSFDDSGSGSGAISNSYVGTVGNGVYIYGAQLEQNIVKTSYINTAASTVTRAVDAITFAMTNFPYSDTAASWFSKHSTNNPINVGIRILADSVINRCFVELFSTTTYAMPYDGTNDLPATGEVFTAGAFSKVALYYNSGASVSHVSANGVSPFSGAFDGTMDCTSLAIGGGAGFVRPVNAYVAQVAFWPRVFSDAQLQSIST